MKSNFPERLKYAMKMNRMKQIDLANKTGIYAGTISNYMRGKYIPKDDKLQILANALGVNVAFLAGFSDDPEPFDDPAANRIIDKFTRMTMPGSFGPVTVSIDDLHLLGAYHNADPLIQSAVRKLLDIPEDRL